MTGEPDRCPGCGHKRLLTEACPVCNNIPGPFRGTVKRLEATRAQLVRSMEDAALERRMGDRLRVEYESALHATRADAEECRRLRDLALKSLELRTAELLAAQEAFGQERAEFVEYQRRLKLLLKPDAVESALSAIDLAQVRMNQFKGAPRGN